MAGTTIRRKSAVAATRGLQFLTLALVAGGVAAATLPGRSHEAEIGGTEPAPGPVDPQPGTAQAPTADYDVIVANLEAWDKPPAPPAPVEVVAGNTEVEEEPAPVSRVRFLGAIMEPKRRLAVLAIDAAQKILAEGQEYDGNKVIEVGETWARVSVRGVEQRIEKAKSTALLSSLTSSPTGGQPVGLQFMDLEVQRQLAEQDEMARKYEGVSRAIPMTTANPNGTTSTPFPPGASSAKAMEAMRRRNEAMARGVPVSGGAAPAGADGNADATGDGGDADGTAAGGPSGGAAAAGGGAADGSPR